MTARFVVIRILALLSVLLGLNYVVWRWLASVNWEAWWIAVPLIVAETYSLVDTFLFAATMWRARERPAPRSKPAGTVDVFITTYNEPLELVMATARAAKKIVYPHETWILDDGARPEMEAAARAAGIGYITRSEDWAGKPRHAKAGNLNNALFHTDGEFLLILDADQIPDPYILTRTLGYFADDPEVALVQTPQWFVNVDAADPLGSQAPLFYGPIQQGKDGWNAAFFCGSNAVLRRDALMQLGIVGYVREVEDSTRSALRAAETLLTKTLREKSLAPEVAHELRMLRRKVTTARAELHAGEPLADVTYRIAQAVREASRRLVERDTAQMTADLAALRELEAHADVGGGDVVVFDPEALDVLVHHDFSPLGAVESVGVLVDAVRVDRPGEAIPVQPLATISVTEDMATAMQLHALGWRSVYHHEILAHGLAPEDLGTMLQQRLRWAQGTMQVMLRDNPLVKKGLSAGQRLMYFATMWSYLAGFAAVIFLAAPVIYLCLGVLPVTAWSVDFFARFIPYFVVNQILFLVVAKGIKTWRGQQYSLALFPVWIRSCTSAFANVVMGKPLGFVVTPKDGSRAAIPWRAIAPQLTAMVLLVFAMIVGVIRVIIGTSDGVGTLVNTVWVIYDLAVLSVIIQAALYRGPAKRVEQPQEAE
ncbi:glycosyltransferase [Microbacterium sediminicola]|uniref:Glycosyltransferase n=1 Tax=Microbacterium sediminicola TaxID=415210 RepID=A0ABP4TXS1_9MICO